MDTVVIPISILKSFIWATVVIIAVLYIFRGGMPGGGDDD